MTDEAASSTSGPLAGLALQVAAADVAATGCHWRVACEAADLPAIAERFRAAGYALEMQTAEDRRPDLGVIRLVASFARLRVVGDSGSVDRHLVIVDLAPGAPAQTLCAQYPAANWMEREIFDMFGVRFTDHPDLKRILLPDDSDFHALRKDFGRIDGTGTEHGAAPTAAQAAHGE